MHPEIVTLALLIWGFLVGFVALTAVFRLPQPIAAWLLEDASGEGSAIAIARLLVMLFLMVVTFTVLSLLPSFLIRFEAMSVERSLRTHWRDYYGLSFLGLVVGFFALGFLRRLGARHRSK
jgi:Na+/proline symporter